MKIINEEDYLSALGKFVKALKKIHLEKRFDAIAAPKRSGLFPGVWASHALSIPMFTPSELRRMPEKFNNILVVDTAVCTGKTLGKIRHQLGTHRVFTAVVWREGESEADFVLEPENIGLIKFFYEV